VIFAVYGHRCREIGNYATICCTPTRLCGRPRSDPVLAIMLFAMLIQGSNGESFGGAGDGALCVCFGLIDTLYGIDDRIRESQSLWTMSGIGHGISLHIFTKRV
jgi:hypothetical protein